MLRELWTVFAERKGFFQNLILEHIEISAIAIMIAIFLGGFVGILISEFQKSAKPTLGVINFLYTIPSISMLGFLIPLSGIGNTTAVIALTIYALLPMVRNTHTGISNIDAGILEAAEGMGSTRLQVLVKVKVPLALPVIMAGIRSMVTMTIALAGIASFIGAGGLGVAIYRGITTNNKAMTLLGSLFIAMLALIVDFFLGYLEKWMAEKRVKVKKNRWVTGTAVALAGAAFIFMAMTGSGKRQTIQIATKPMTEQYILGEMLSILIEQDTNLKVEITQGVGGGTSNIQPAMEAGEFDLYLEYTGTGYNMVLKKEGLYTEDMFENMQREYKDELDMQWIGMFGFNNTYGLAVSDETAAKYHLKTYSDLAAVSGQLAFGAEYDFFEREDGYDALCDAYGFQFIQTMDMDIGLKYQAMQEGKIDVMNIFTTDGQLSVSDVTVLEDDKSFYPSYLCGNVIRSKVLDENPGLNGVFEKLSGILDDDKMAFLNYEVEAEGKEPKAVAEKFLKDAGLSQ